jgi:hypothetical protein
VKYIRLPIDSFLLFLSRFLVANLSSINVLFLRLVFGAALTSACEELFEGRVLSRWLRLVVAPLLLTLCLGILLLALLQWYL